MYRNRPVVSHELTIFRSFDYLYVYKCDVLCDLVPFAQFTKNVKNTNGAVLLLVTLQTWPLNRLHPKLLSFLLPLNRLHVQAFLIVQMVPNRATYHKSDMSVNVRDNGNVQFTFYLVS